MSATPAPQYYITSGVRRAVAAREVGLADIAAQIVEPAKPDIFTRLALDQLHSPKPFLFRNGRYLTVEIVTRAGKIILPIEVHPLGLRGQVPSVPPLQVQLRRGVPMKKCPPELARRLLYIIHRGFVEARLLALGERHQQLFDLADALENFSSYVDNWDEEYMELIRFNLRTYQDKDPGICFDYLANLERDAVPERF